MPFTIDRYEILDELGQGAMATVYKAYDPRINRELAIKVLRPEHTVNAEFLSRFLRETRAVGKLNHPNIIKIYDVGEYEDQPYIAMELLTGQFLDHFMDSGQRFSMEDVIDIAKQLSSALDCAHSNGVIHRDIKPANIAWSEKNKRIILTDFGIARIENIEATQSTLIGQVLGTPKYMSPEQILGKHIDGRTDLFSLGVVLYQLITGQKPFSGDTLASLTFQITQQDPPPVEQYTPEAPRALVQVIQKLLRKDPNDRFKDAKALLQALAAIDLGAETFLSPRKTSPFKYIAIAAALALGVLVVFYIKGLLQPEPKDISKSISIEEDIRKQTQESQLAKKLQAQINSSLVRFECASLYAVVNSDKAVSIKGHISHEEDLLALMDIMDTIPEANNVLYEVDTLVWPYCEVASILSEHNQRKPLNGRGLQIDTQSHSHQLIEGNKMTIEFSAPDFASYLYVDYYRSDGTVVHLYPQFKNGQEKIPPATRLSIGENASPWVIKKPFGENQIVLMATEKPLIKEQRPLQEPAQDYLSFLHNKVIVNETPVAAKYLMVTTNPRT
ncbi:MAG: protein kinase [Gammaproteobacteria bacterium]|jgi:serine/threonine protein kinase